MAIAASALVTAQRMRQVIADFNSGPNSHREKLLLIRPGLVRPNSVSKCCHGRDRGPRLRAPVTGNLYLNGRTSVLGALQAPATNFLSAVSANPATIRICRFVIPIRIFVRQSESPRRVSQHIIYGLPIIRPESVANVASGNCPQRTSGPERFTDAP